MRPVETARRTAGATEGSAAGADEGTGEGARLGAVVRGEPAADQWSTPLLDALQDYAVRRIVRFHMPGHKGGQGIHDRLKALAGEGVFSLDVTGVEGLDDLHEPAGVLRSAQALAADAFGADHSFFLVNGTSAGVQAMILATCRPGEPILVSRNIHKSILSGIILSGAQPVFIQPVVDRDLGIAMGVTPEAVSAALDRHPDARAALVVNPTYYGVSADLSRIAALVHARGKPLLVDEAHGPHFRFHEKLPTPALTAGADACAQGMHKILGGMTQASILHLKGGRVGVGRVRAVLQLIQSTSASYVLMASLDAARMQIATEGRELLDRAIMLAGRLRYEVNRIPGLCAFGEERLGGPAAAALDPTKLTVTVKGLGLTGQQVEMILHYRYGIQVEMSDLFNVLLIVGFGNTEEDAGRFLAALADLARTAPGYRSAETDRMLARGEQVGVLPLPELAVSPREAFFSPSRPIPLDEAVGRVCAEVITCYPPGIPIICPGERFTPEVVDHLFLMREAGFRISGPRNPSLATVQVL